MKIVSPFLKRVVYPALSLAGTFHRTSATGLAVVTYHGVLPEGYKSIDGALDGNLITAEMLYRQLRLLKTHYDLISPDDVLAWHQRHCELPPRAVLLTCDDGLLNCLTDMLPVLQAEKVQCLFFVTGASAGEARTMLWYENLFLLFLRAPSGPFEVSAGKFVVRGELRSGDSRRAIWWDSVKRLSQVDEGSRASFIRAARIQFGLEADRDFKPDNAVSCQRFGLLTCAELRELTSAGMTIGAHTLSHPMLSQQSPESAYAEMFESRVRLESALQRRVWAFAYPFGHPQSVTAQVLAMPQKAGYEIAFLNFGGGLGTHLPPFELPRVHVTAEMKLAEFEAQVSGFYMRLHRRAERPAPSVAITQGSASK